MEADFEATDSGRSRSILRRLCRCAVVAVKGLTLWQDEGVPGVRGGLLDLNL